MKNIQVVLSIVSINLMTGEYYVLSLDSDKLILPCQDLHQYNLINSLDIIKKMHIDLDTNWINHKLVSCIDDNHNIVVVYNSVIPHDTTLKNAHWLPIWKCVDNPIISEVLQYL